MDNIVHHLPPRSITHTSYVRSSTPTSTTTSHVRLPTLSAAELISPANGSSSLKQVTPPPPSAEMTSVSAPPSNTLSLETNNLDASVTALHVDPTPQLVNPTSSPVANAHKGDKPWTSFFNKPNLVSLKYTPSTNEKFLQLHAGLAQIDEAKWENTLVGFFIDKKLPH